MLHGNSRLICRKWRSARSEKTPSSPRGDGKEGFPIAIRNLLKDLPKESHFSQQFASFGHFKLSKFLALQTIQRLFSSWQLLKKIFLRWTKGNATTFLMRLGWGIWICLEFRWVDLCLPSFFFPKWWWKVRGKIPSKIPVNHSGLCYESVWTCSCPKFRRWWVFWSCKKPIDGSFELFAIDCFEPWCK